MARKVSCLHILNLEKNILQSKKHYLNSSNLPPIKCKLFIKNTFIVKLQSVKQENRKEK